MNKYYFLIIVYLLTIHLNIYCYHINFDSFSSICGGNVSNESTLNSNVTDIQGGILFNDDYQIISSFMLENFTPNTSSNDIVDQILKSELHQNYPNPFNPNTTIHFTLKTKTKIVISIYNTKGQLIRELTNSDYEAGHNIVEWNGTDEFGKICASGIYFIKMQENYNTFLRKAILLK